MSLLGSIDALLSSGYIEGWLWSRSQPETNPEVRILAQDSTVARGFACRYRKDLAEAGLGWGWNGFRLPLLSWPPRSPARPWLELMSGDAAVWSGAVGWVQDRVHRYTDVAELIGNDPTQVRDVSALIGLRDHLKQLCAQLGAEAFIRRCYLAILGRAPDPSGLADYSRLLAAGEADPYGVVTGLMNSAEFLNSSRGVYPPVLSSFPFALEAHATSSEERADILSGSHLLGA